MTGTMVRKPMQQRSRESWQRVLDAGVEIIKEGEVERLTISALCKRARVAPTVIYARVSGLTDLYWSLYDHGMTAVNATVARLLDRCEHTPAGSQLRIDAVVDAVDEIFRTHADFLRPILAFAAQNAQERARGSIHAQAFVARITALLDCGDPVAARDVAAALHRQNVFRLLFGNGWLTKDRQTDGEFKAQLRRIAAATLGESTKQNRQKDERADEVG